MTRNTTTLAIAFSVLGSLASAMDEIPATETPIVAEINPAQEYIAPICALSNVNLSEKAQLACSGDLDAIPAMLKDGSRLSSRGVGAEFNTLLNNINVFAPATVADAKS